MATKEAIEGKRLQEVEASRLAWEKIARELARIADALEQRTAGKAKK